MSKSITTTKRGKECTCGGAPKGYPLTPHAMNCPLFKEKFKIVSYGINPVPYIDIKLEPLEKEESLDWESEIEYYIPTLQAKRLKEQINSEISKAVSKQSFSASKERERIREKAYSLYDCIGADDEIHRCSYGHCENCGTCDLVSELITKIEEDR